MESMIVIKSPKFVIILAIKISTYNEDGLRKRDIRKAQRPDVKKRKRS